MPSFFRALVTAGIAAAVSFPADVSAQTPNPVLAGSHLASASAGLTVRESQESNFPASALGPVNVLPPTDSVVTADALPTVQIDGVAWDQEVVGNTVYVAGKFSTARPAGAEPGVSTVRRANLLAYELSTGRLISSFEHDLNGQALTVVASPDKSTIYVGGDFTLVDGKIRKRIAAFDVATGRLTDFAPFVGFQVRAIQISSSAVYVGGTFNTAGILERKNLASFRFDGSLTGWNPGADGPVRTLLLTPDGSKLLAGGHFTRIGGEPSNGLAALDPGTGTRIAWPGENVFDNNGRNSAITSLTTDGNDIYGSGYSFEGGGSLEGSFSLTPAGELRWAEDCHGDTYDVWAGPAAVYVASHAHYCGNIGSFEQTNPWQFQHAMAFSKQATDAIDRDPWGGIYKNHENKPSPSQYHWFPRTAIGAATGMGQSTWTIEGTSEYVLLGGEFPRVNSRPQQGLVRFAVRSLAPNAEGPQLASKSWVPELVGAGPGQIRVGIPANFDRDDPTLTYRFFRDGTLRTVQEHTSAWWNRPAIGFVDTGLRPGTSYAYRVEAIDRSGRVTSSASVSLSAPDSGGLSAHGQQVVADGASHYFPMNESSGDVMHNHAYGNGGFADAVRLHGVGLNAPGATSDGSGARFNGTPRGTVTVQGLISDPSGTFSLGAFIQTTTSQGGKILALDNSMGGSDDSKTGRNYDPFADRQLYLDNAGRPHFVVGGPQASTILAERAVNDGAWHQIVGTVGANGSELYVDGVRVAAEPRTTSVDPRGGYWRIGGNAVRNMPTDAPASGYLSGMIDEVSIYPLALTAQQVSDQYRAAGYTPQTPPSGSANEPGPYQWLKSSYSPIVYMATGTWHRPASYEDWSKAGFPSPGGSPTEFVHYPWSPHIWAVTFWPDGWQWDRLSYDQWLQVGTPQPRTAGWIAGSVVWKFADSETLYVTEPTGETHHLSFEEWAAMEYRQPSLR
jgi:hypothetical protein